MNKSLAKLIFRMWPFPFGHVRLMYWLSPPNIGKKYIVSKLKGFSVRLKYDPDSYIGRYIYYRGIFEEQVINKIANLTKPGMTFLDIGANIGLHANIAASLVGENGRVIAVEPQSKARKLLEENIALNHYSNIDVVSCALGRESGSGNIYLVNSGNDGEGTLVPKDKNSVYSSESVRIKPLDTLLDEMDIRHVDIVKIDVEGAEMEVFRGGQNFFQSFPPKYIFIECVDRHLQRFGESSESLLAWLDSYDYSVYGRIRGSWKKIHTTTALDLDLMAIKK